MNTIEFFRNIWPAQGLYIIARLVQGKFRHQVCDSIEEAAAYALQFDSQGVATYHACAVFREREVKTTRPNGEVWHQVRTRANVRALKCFWMDLDVEPGNPTKFESQEQAIEALVDFCQSTKLPIPMIVSSGGGIHIYWTLIHEILPETWKPIAEGLKALAVAHNFRADSAITADPARILRPVGTTNRKLAGVLRPVGCVASADQCDLLDFQRRVLHATKAAGIKPPETVRQVEAKAEVLNQAFAIQHEFPPCSGEKVATRCAQLAKMRDTRGCIPEPHWYACIQLLCHSTEGDALIHQWSNGYEGYSEVETTRKIAQVRGQSLGPTLCATFESRVPGGCDACPFKGKISSPAQLGAQVTSAPAPILEVKAADQVATTTIPNPPLPFTRGEKGGIYVEVDGIQHKVYEYDCYPIEIAFDEDLNYEAMRIRHWLPQEGWHECTIQSSLIAKPVEFDRALRDQHIQSLNRNQFAMYFDSYLRKLKAETKLKRLFRRQGWKNDETEFVLGDKLYRKGEIARAGTSSGISNFLRPFHSRGRIEPWRNLTWALGTPGFEPHAFMLLIAFAAPLLKLDLRGGFTVSALGLSGAGKSTMGQWLTSVYGHPTDLWAKSDDSLAARMRRLGAYYSVPLYMDEVTTISGKDLRSLVYSVATGKSRDTLKTDRSLRPGDEWTTILVTSTNNSLLSKLQTENANAEGESMRLFEFRFPKIEAFGEVAKLVPHVVLQNYGVAGELYIQYLVNNRDRIKVGVRTAIEQTEHAWGMDQRERFWSQAAALSIYGGQLAREAGIIDFDPELVRPWLQDETRRVRKTVDEGFTDSVSALAEFLNEHVSERLVVTKLNANLVVPSTKPLRELSQRFEKDSNVIYISRRRIFDYFSEHHLDYGMIRDDLLARGVLLKNNLRRTLGADTDLGGGPVQCWMVRTDHPELGGLVDAAP